MAMQGLNRVLGGALLVSGTCIGAGMLSFPVATAAAGWQVTLGAFFIVWFIMTFTALLMLEVSLHFEKENNLISMARATLGQWGAGAAWLVYVLFFYALMTAYTSGGAALVQELVQGLTGHTLSIGHSTGLLVGIFAIALYYGTMWVDWLNRAFMVGLCIAYGVLVATAVPAVDPGALVSGHVDYIWSAAPLFVTSFGFHLLIPSLKSYLKHNPKWLRYAVILGSMMSLAVFIIWEYVILGLMTQEQLLLMAETGQPAKALTHMMENVLQNDGIIWGAKLFMLFALLSSFIGVALAIFDFFADGFGIRKTPWGKFGLLILTLGIPAYFSFIEPEGFIVALRYAGVFAAILLIIYPVIMAVSLRARVPAHSYRVQWGIPLGIIALCFGVGVVILQYLDTIGALPKL